VTGAAPFAWWLLGGLLLAASRPWNPVVVLAWAVPWAVGLVLVRRDAADAWRGALASPLARHAIVLLPGLLLAASIVAGPFAALTLSAWLGMLLLWTATRGPEALRGTIIGLALAGTLSALLVAAAELALAAPAIADRLGTPAARTRWEAQYDSLWTRNVLGLRSRHETLARRAGVRRIVALGDSFTWGDKLASADSAWPGQLEQLLAAAGPVEVINLGQRGWTTANEGEMLRRLGWQFTPDAIVWQFFINDAFESRPDFGRDGEDWISVLPARLRTYPIGRSATIYLVDRLGNQLLRGQDAASGYGPLYRRDSAGWRQLEAALREAADSSRRRGIPILFVLFPAFVPGEWTAESYPLRSYYAQVAEAARGAGLHVIDLIPRFAAAGGDWRRWWALPWDSHPDAHAQRLAAEAIAAELRRVEADTGQSAPSGAP